MIRVIKRSGIIEDFDINKPINAVKNAFSSFGKEMPERYIEQITNLFQKGDITNVEDIQDKIEVFLMKNNNFKIAKAFILYREKHKLERDITRQALDFIEKYKHSDNTANATIDDNSNVSTHNIAVLNSEIHKENNRIINIRLLKEKLKELYPDFNNKQFDEDIDSIMYWHDSSSQIGMPYCVAISLYPFLLNGLKDIGGLSAAPKNIDSFCGMFVNLLFAIAGQFKGAVAAPGLFVCMDYFLRKAWGDSYYLRLSDCISNDGLPKKQTIVGQVHQYFQQICYTLMQPSGSRGNQAVFWNVSIFDKPFFDTMYGDFYYPDGTKAEWESINWLQKDFLHWLNQERLKCILTFPVVSGCLIYRDGEFLDKELAGYFAQEYAEGNSFFTYISDSADSLSSCCRLSSKIEKPQFNFTNGQLSEMTGSKNVITLNMNRIIQNFYRYRDDHIYDATLLNSEFKKYLVCILHRVYKYHIAYNELLEDMKESGLMPVYDAGFISMNKQYLTIGINGLNQAAEFMGLQCNNNKDYKAFCNLVFSTIKEENAKHKAKGLMFNTELTPCESAAIKLYNKDKKDGYWVPDDTNLYASYIYKPNDPVISVLDKLYLHGNAFCGDYLDGGSSAHINLDAHLSKEAYMKILRYAAEVGCKYFTFNVPNCECEDCGFIAKQPFTTCPKCGSTNVSLWDRVIGYLTKIKNWSSGRRQEQKTRSYNHNMVND